MPTFHPRLASLLALLLLAGAATSSFAQSTQRRAATNRRPTVTRAHGKISKYVTQRKQNDALTEILDLAGPDTVVQLDADLTTLMPVERTHQALRSAGIDPATLDELPGYTDEAYEAWITPRQGQFPNMPPRGRLPGYWNLSLLPTDSLTPGLVDFVSKLRGKRANAIVNSGRMSSWEANTRAAYQQGGLDLPAGHLLIGSDGSDAATKAQRQAEIATRFGRTIAVVEDRVDNSNAILSALPNGGAGVLQVGIAIPGFSVDPRFHDAARQISTFVLTRRAAQE